MTNSSPVAGSQLHIGTTASDPLADTYTNRVGELTDFGDIGRVYALAQHQGIYERGMEKHKAGYDDGNMNLMMAMDADDAGQLAVEDALDDDHDYNFKITLNDASEVSGSHPTYIYFKAKVTSFPMAIGQIGNVVQRRLSLAIAPATIQIIYAT